jgi:hypothetical protein
MIHEDLIRDAITKLKANPSLTLTQYNNYLATKQWYEAAIIRYFVYKTAMGLAQHYNVSLTSYTETAVMQKVRDWIVATPANKLEKILLGK